MFRTYKNCICIKGGNNDNSARILKLSAFGGQTEATHWLRPTAKHTQRGHQRGEILLGQARDGAVGQGQLDPGTALGCADRQLQDGGRPWRRRGTGGRFLSPWGGERVGDDLSPPSTPRPHGHAGCMSP